MEIQHFTKTFYYLIETVYQTKMISSESVTVTHPHCRYFYTAQHHGLRRLPRNWGRAVALVTSHTHASQVTRGSLQATSHVSRPQFVADRGFPANGKLTLSATPSNVHSIASQKFLPSSGDNNDKNLHISTARHRWKTADLSSIDFWI